MQIIVGRATKMYGQSRIWTVGAGEAPPPDFGKAGSIKILTLYQLSPPPDLPTALMGGGGPSTHIFLVEWLTLFHGGGGIMPTT